MAMIQVQVRKNFINDVLIDGGLGVNIITKNLRMQLGISKPNPTLYNMWMAYQTIAKPLALVENPPFSTSPLSTSCHFLLHFRLQIFRY
jgi:hypothetical protein